MSRRFHISGAAALFDEQEQPISLSYLGIAAVNVMAQSNWTAAMTRAGVPLRDRVNRHLLLIEVRGVGAAVRRSGAARDGGGLGGMEPSCPRLCPGGLPVGGWGLA